MNLSKDPTPTIELQSELLSEKGVRLYIKRDDLIDPEISGNKYRKLKYNLLAANEQGHDTLLTFGGAYSNHIYAVAAAGKKYNFNTIGIIRGEEHHPLNPTLDFAKSCGMRLEYVSREKFRKKDTAEFHQELITKFGNFYTLPEGGTNQLAVKGCAEIVSEIDVDYTHICCACGTGGTIAGVISASDKQVLGFPVLKGGDFLKEDIQKLIGSSDTNWQLITDYHFGGYAKLKPELIDFIQDFQNQFNIPLDPVYTGKMFFGIMDLIDKDYFPMNSSIVAIHTGGLQGIDGMKERGLIS